jgi:hypothetical protein
VASYTFSHPANPDDVHGTGWAQNLAGQGRWTERQRRGAAVRSGQFHPLPLPNIQGPLAGLNAAHADVVQPFANEVHRDVGRDMLVGALSGALLGYGLTRASQRRRSR